MTALSAQTIPTTVHDQRTARSVLEEQWQQQVADIIELSYDALTPADDDEDGSRANERHVTTQLLAAARQQLVETEAALARLDDSTYGLCVDCSNPISAERLEILPAARYCVACQAARSRRR